MKTLNWDDVLSGLSSAVSTIQSAPSKIAEGVSFAQDPVGWMCGKLADAINGLSTVVIPAILDATKPDLSAEWFLDAYKMSFGFATIVYCVLLLINLVRTARGTISSVELIDSIGYQTPRFFIGASFGPMVGVTIIGITHELTNFLIEWGIAASAEDQLRAIHEAANTSGWPAGLGNSIIALLLLAGMVTALLIVVIVHLVAFVTLYFTGVLVPLGMVWMTDPKHQAMGSRLLWVWLGVLLAHPLMVFLLGIAFWFTTSVNNGFEDSTMDGIANLIAAMIALFMAGLMPVLLYKFAPVLPTTAGQQGPSLYSNSNSESGHGGGSKSPADAAQKNAEQEFDDQTSGDGWSSASRGDADSPTSDAGSSGSGSSSDPVSTSKGSGSEADSAAGQQSGNETAHNDPKGDGPTTGPAPDADSLKGAAVEDGVGAGAAGAGAEGATAAEATAAVGAGETATGVGAAVGIPTLIAAGAMAAGEKAWDMTSTAAEAGANQAVGDMDDQEGAGR